MRSVLPAEAFPNDGVFSSGNPAENSGTHVRMVIDDREMLKSRSAQTIKIESTSIVRLVSIEERIGN